MLKHVDYHDKLLLKTSRQTSSEHPVIQICSFRYKKLHTHNEDKDEVELYIELYLAYLAIKRCR